MDFAFTILGCGSSGGVPRITGDWGACNPDQPRNRRRRCSALVTRQAENAARTDILIDCSPDMRDQLLDASTGFVDAVLFTHDHADQTHGIDDLRAMVYERRKRLDVWMDEATSRTLESRFGYCFSTPHGSDYPPILENHMITRDMAPIKVSGSAGSLTAVPFQQVHGNIDSLGFRIGNIAYSSDISDLPVKSFEIFDGVDIWVVDALRREPHPTHFHLDKTLRMIEMLGVKQAVLTNLHIDLDYDALCRELPAHIRPAYDGLRLVGQLSDSDSSS
jgi:phosphoribosyl 1,2-cyclic phosphate phosphodiesterase